MRPLLCALLLGCGPKAPPAPAPVAAGPPQSATWSVRAANHIVSPQPLVRLVVDHYDVQLLAHGAWSTGAAMDLRFVPTVDGSTPLACAATTAWSAVPVDAEGRFQVTGATLALEAADVPITFQQVDFVGQLTGGSLVAEAVTGVVDTRELAPMVDPDKPGSLCGLVSGILPCGACPDDGEPFCWEVRLEEVRFVSSDAVVPSGERVEGEGCE